VARASLEELRLDYEVYLRQRGLAQWPPEYPALARFKARRCATLDQVREWIEEEWRSARTNTDLHGLTRKKQSPGSAEFVANAALSLLNLGCHLLDRQIAAQGKAFVEEGGFTERLYRVRSQRRARG
jgi:four helix bundle suffix protein